MIRTDEVFKIGYITKHRGLRGEVELSFTDDCFDTGDAEYLVLDMDGIFVPFFWEEYRFKNNDTAIVKFEHIDNEEQARRLAGHAVFYPKAHVAASKTDGGQTLSSYKALTGFTVYDAAGKALGEITHVDDSSANTLITLAQADGQEFILPFHNDFLVNFDLKERFLQLELPEGLLEIND